MTYHHGHEEIPWEVADPYLREQKWDITAGLFAVDKRLSSHALAHFYDTNLLVSIKCDTGFAIMLSTVVPFFELVPSVERPNIALSIYITIVDGLPPDYYGARHQTVLIEGRHQKLGEILISGRYLPRLVMLLNSLQSPFSQKCYGSVRPELDYAWQIHGTSRITFDFTISIDGDGYYNKRSVVDKLIDLLDGLHWPRNQWEMSSFADGRKVRVRNESDTWMSPASGARKLSKDFGTFVTQDDCIAWSTYHKLLADEYVLQSGGYTSARAHYQLAAYLIRKNGCQHYLKLPEVINRRGLMPEQNITDLALEIWMAQSQLSARLGRYPRQAWIHLEAKSTADLAFRVGKLASPKRNPDLLLRLKLNYADKLLEPQRHFLWGRTFPPAEEGHYRAHLAGQDYDLDDSVAGYPQNQKSGAYRIALSLLTSANDMYPEDLNVYGELVECRAFHITKNRLAKYRPSFPSSLHILYRHTPPQHINFTQEQYFRFVLSDSPKATFIDIGNIAEYFQNFESSRFNHRVKEYLHEPIVKRENQVRVGASRRNKPPPQDYAEMEDDLLANLSLYDTPAGYGAPPKRYLSSFSVSSDSVRQSRKRQRE